MEIKRIILEHRAKYPLMQIEDYIKLIYQNEFGGGHLIKDEQKSLERLINEINGMDMNNKEIEIIEIGNNILRVPLNIISNLNISIEEFNKLFIESSKIVYGDVEKFKEKLKVLQDMTIAGELNFTKRQLDDFLDEYSLKGYPMISHSILYKEEYNPHYRIIDKELLKNKIKI